jgi:hypothetical protein
LEFVEHLTAHAPTHDYTTTSRQQFVDCPPQCTFQALPADSCGRLCYNS